MMIAMIIVWTRFLVSFSFYSCEEGRWKNNSCQGMVGTVWWVLRESGRVPIIGTSISNDRFSLSLLLMVGWKWNGESWGWKNFRSFFSYSRFQPQINRHLSSLTHIFLSNSSSIWLSNFNACSICCSLSRSISFHLPPLFEWKWPTISCLLWFNGYEWE